MTNTKFRFVQLSDLHLVADEKESLFDINPFNSFKNIIERIQKLSLRPDFLLLTGDMAHKEQEKPYELVDKVIKPTGFTYYWLEGNHDNIVAMKEAEAKFSVNPLRSFEHKKFQFILLNSVSPINRYGEFSKETLDFLKTELEKSKNRLCIIAFHHQVLPTGCPWIDKSMIQNTEEFFEIVNQYQNIKAILHGHIHNDFSLEKHGLSIFSAPSTAFQFDLDTESFTTKKANVGFRIFDINENNNLKTRVERV